MKRLILCLFLAFGIAEAQDPPRFVLDASVDPSRLDLGPFLRDIWPAMMTVMTPAKIPVPEIKVRFRPGVLDGGSCVGNLVSLSNYPDPSTLRSYDTFVHELAHAISYCAIQSGIDTTQPAEPGQEVIVGKPDQFLTEGYATAVDTLVYQKLAAASKTLLGGTNTWTQPAYNNLPLQIIGGGPNFQDNRYFSNFRSYQNASATFELIAQRLGSLKRLDEAISLAKPLNRAEYLAVVDRVVGKIDGVLPSTLFNSAPASFTKGPDGTFFGIVFLGGSFEPTDPAKIASDAPVNPQSLLVWFFSRQNGVRSDKTGTLRFAITDASGKTVLSGTGPAANFNVAERFGSVLSLPDGGYKLSACVLRSDNACDPELTDGTYFAVLKTGENRGYSKPWTRDKVLVLANTGRPLRVLDAGGAVSVEALPDLLVISAAVRDITVTDGVTTRVISPTTISRIVFFKDRDQPYLEAVTNPTTFEKGRPVVPGSIVTFWTWGATHGDPEVSTATPLPTACCGKLTQVLFTGSDGRTLAAPFFYCSQLQLNVQVPRDLRGPTAWVQVRLGEAFSNQLEVQVADASPSIFIMDLATQTGAVIFASGDRAGQLVTRDNPAHPGDYLAVYATGLGETIPPMPGDGIAPPPPPPPSVERPAAAFVLYTTLRPVVASANGAPWKVLFAGLAPGFVGLYQVNVQVPETLAPGNYPFILTMEGTERRTSNEILLAVR